MELQFESSPCQCLKRVLCEVRCMEQAQEIRLTDGMPDIGRVLCGWGQVLVRSKEWNGDSISLSAGMMVWVLYAPEDGTEVRWVEGWIPFSVSWDLPENCPEGSFTVQCLNRFVDARSVSARKIMVRAGLGAMAQAFVPAQEEIFFPQQETAGAELKKVQIPMRLPREAGEKAFTLEEDLTLPGTVPPMDRVIYYCLEPEVQEQRVMTDKIVFRGAARLHILYREPGGNVHSWDFSVPFSQFDQLKQSCSAEAEVSVCCSVTALEAEQLEENRIHLKASLTGQYLVDDQQVLELIQDAYSPQRDLEVETRMLQLHGLLQKKKDMAAAEMNIPGEGEQAVDVQFLPDFPRLRTLPEGVRQELAGTFQILCYSGDGSLQAAVSRWEGSQTLAAGEDADITVQPLAPSEPQILLGGGDMKVRTEFPLQISAYSEEGIPMVTGLNLGEMRQPDENRPSLIIRRAGEGDLWSVAKATGSTVSAIRSANHLQQEPVDGQMLLIPIL